MSDGKVVAAELIAGQAAVRQFVDSTVYGHLISDDVCQQIAATVVTAVDEARTAAVAAEGKTTDA